MSAPATLPANFFTVNPEAARQGPKAPDTLPADFDFGGASDSDSLGNALREYGRKMNPLAMGQGINDLFTHNPVDTAKGYGSQNQQIADEAEKAWKNGDYIGAAAHSLYYLLNGIPGLGAALDEAGNKFRANKPKEALADTAAIATQLYLGAKAPEIANGAGNAIYNAPRVMKDAAGAITDTALSPGTRDVVGIFSPRAKNALDMAARARKALGQAQAPPDAAAAAPAPVVGPPAPPPNGTPLRPPMAPPDSSSAIPSSPADAINPQTNFTGPVRPPLSAPPAMPAPTEPAETAIPFSAAGGRAIRMPRKAPASQPTTTPAAPAQPVAPIAEMAPADVMELSPAEIAARLKAEMEQSGTAPAETPAAQAAPEAPRVTAIKQANAAAKGQRIAEALHEYGITSDVLGDIPDGTTGAEKIAAGEVPGWGDIIDHLVSQGKLPKGTTVPNLSKPEVLFYLQKLEKGATLEPDAVVREGAGGEAGPLPQEVRGSGAPGASPAASNAPGGAAAAADPTQTEVLIPGSDRAYGAQYQVRELSEIQPSHNGQTFQPNPNYELTNDRDYNEPDNRAKVVNGSLPGKFNPRYHITDNPDATNGPVVIDAAGNAIGGNGRAMILQRVYASNPEGAQAYRDLLTQKAAQFGLDPQQIAGMKQPVLVRMVHDSDLIGSAAKQDAITDLNKTGTAALRPAERAIADSRRVSPDTLDFLGGRLEAAGSDATLAGVLDGKTGVQVLNRLIDDGVIGPQERAAYASGDALTADGKARISKLVLGRFFRDPSQLDSIAPSLRNKIEYAAAPLAKVEGNPQWNLSPSIHEAIDILEGARSHGAKNLDDFLNQSGLFGDQEHSAQAVALARAMQKMKPTEFRDAARQYAQDAKFSAEGPDMFGNEVKPEASFADAFGKAK